MKFLFLVQIPTWEGRILLSQQICRVEEIKYVLPLKCVFHPLCNGKFHQVLEGAVKGGIGYVCCCIKSCHLSIKMKHSQNPAK